MSAGPTDAAKQRLAFKRALALIELYAKALRQAGSDPEIVAALHSMIAILSQTSDAALPPSREPQQKGRPRRNDVQFGDDTIAQMTLAEIDAHARSPTTTLPTLKRLGSVRFAFAPGMLSRVSRQALIDKLREAIESERTHDTIAKLAGRR